ncbi:hypothetical protein [Shimazuella alba]|uniref:Uncharacterized protein n=1 Tax=Shimazuella alba TaxID=2690964 RepID=A0A6I4VWY1_9BACL|nr:hypothetical protein [Shimazuella alba]MXQ52522.1 hypothetical protein [Shimazuella alba]
MGDKMDDKKFFDLLDYEGKDEEQLIRKLEKLLKSDRPELNPYRPEFEQRLAELKEKKANQ